MKSKSYKQIDPPEVQLGSDSDSEYDRPLSAKQRYVFGPGITPKELQQEITDVQFID